MATAGGFDEATINRVVNKIVEEVQDSMLNFELQKAAQVGRFHLNQNIGYGGIIVCNCCNLLVVYNYIICETIRV